MRDRTSDCGIRIRRVTATLYPYDASKRIRTSDLLRIRRKLFQLSYACIRSYSDSNAEYGVRSPAVFPLAYKSKTPCTGRMASGGRQFCADRSGAETEPSTSRTTVRRTE